MAAMKLPRFQFCLRTLMIGVALVAVCCWVGQQANMVRERKRWMLSVSAAIDPSDDSPLPWHRRLLGDVWTDMVVVEDDSPDDEFREIQAAFPEAKVVWRKDIPR